MPPPNMDIERVAAQERKTLDDDRLYVTGVQTRNVQVIDPKSGHSVAEIEAESDAVGLALSPGGRQLYIADDDGRQNGRLRVIDTWSGLETCIERLPYMAHLIAGNPVSLSDDGRWLVTAHSRGYDGTDGPTSWFSLYDTVRKSFWSAPERPAARIPAELSNCMRDALPPELIGRPGHGRLYIACNGYTASIDPATLKTNWRANTVTGQEAHSVLSTDERRLYTVYSPDDGSALGPHETDRPNPRLSVYDARTGHHIRTVSLARQKRLSDGPAETAYIASIGKDADILVALGDKLWRFEPDIKSYVEVAELPSTVGTLVTATFDGQEFAYITPSWSDDHRPKDEPGLVRVDLRDGSIKTVPDWPQVYRITTLLPGSVSVDIGIAEQGH